MEPNAQIAFDDLFRRFFDEMQRQIGDLDTRLNHRFGDIENHHDTRLQALEYSIAQASTEFESWRPQVDTAVTDLKLEMSKLNKHMDRVLLDRSPNSCLLDAPKSASARPPTGAAVDGPTGHRNDNHHRDHGSGMVFTHSHIPVKGTHHYSSHSPKNSPLGTDPESRSDRVAFGRLPKLQFPSFDGPKPKLWISCCENYFDMYVVPSDMWIRAATHHCTGPAGQWLQSVERRISAVDWSEFCSLLLDRFGRYEHDVLIRQLLHIRQTATVADYITQFSELVDQLAAYESPLDTRHYTMKFIDGLRPDI